MSSDENVHTLEAIAEARALLEDLTRLAEELKLRHAQLGELLAPSEAALQARTEYLDRVLKEQLSQSGQRVTRLAEDVDRIVRNLSDTIVQMPARVAEIDARRWQEMARRERWRTGVSLLAMLLGGFLAGQAATWRTTTKAAVPAATEAPSAAKSAPAVKPRPSVAPAR
jgi:hypothetical protein